MSAMQTIRPQRRQASVAKPWLRALAMTAPIAQHPDRIFPNVVEERAIALGDAPALMSEGECLTYRDLALRTNQFARWMRDQGLAKGDTVCLIMPNRPEYLAIWLGISKIGGVVALLNTHLVGTSLAHCINIVAPKHVIAGAEFVNRLTAVIGDLTTKPTIWVHGAASDSSFRRLDVDVERYPGDALGSKERCPTTVEDRALYIYTSGTTGLPKAASISHGRVMQWSHWFAAMMDAQPSDRLYDCLPMFHASGGVQAPGAALVGGGSVVLRNGFSTRQFWSDIIRWDCTLFQYIGEQCRYLLHGERSSQETGHRIRMACGNGMRPEVWPEFQRRFGIPQIFEFYAATEGAVSLFNVEGEPGAIGRIPSYLAHRSPVALVKFDVEQQLPARDGIGLCIPCAPNEAGEAIGPLMKGPSHIGSRFEGYSDAEASEKKVLRNVFKTGDAWFRTGDLMRKDDRGFFYFVDRVGDTFRWKGENVATSEVSEAICAFPGVEQANVYGVAIPGTDGRAGMAALVCRGHLNLPGLREHLLRRLPRYACPVFLRIQQQMELTATFKYPKAELVRQGCDPEIGGGLVYFHHPGREAFIPMDRALHEQIQNGQIRF